jgi:hypothetical protein
MMMGLAAAVSGWMFVPRELDRRPWRWLFVRITACFAIGCDQARGDYLGTTQWVGGGGAALANSALCFSRPSGDGVQ